MSPEYFISQSFSAVAIVFGMCGYLAGSERRLKLMLSTAAACQAVHFMLLGAGQGAFQSLLTSSRFLISVWWRSQALFWVFVLLSAAVGVWKYRSPIDVLPVLANFMACVAVFHLHGLPMRYCLLMVTFFWFVYNAWNNSVFGCVLELSYATMNILAIRSFRRNYRS